MQNSIQIKNAYANNLKNIDLEIPKNKMVVITGVSGSGKSSIAFNILNNESRRQYMESLGLITDGVAKAKCSWVKGLPPSISIEQHLNIKNPRSTVGTVTEIYTYIRLLFAKLGSIDGVNYNWIAADFSFNKPSGACECCTGLGIVNDVDIVKLIDISKSIPQYAVYEWDINFIERNTRALISASQYYKYKFSINDAVCDYNTSAKTLLFYGSDSKQMIELYPHITPPKKSSEGRFEGLITNIKRRYSQKANNKKAREKLQKYFNEIICPTCNGNRLKNTVCNVTLANKTIIEVQKMTIRELNDWLKLIPTYLNTTEHQIAKPILNDLKSRVSKLLKVNVEYLSLIRAMPSLSNGEAQRLKIANLLSSGLSGVLYILDEPTKGLHGRDVKNLIEILNELKEQGNHLLLVEHNPTVIKKADYLIDMGPDSGKYGGEVIATGTPDQVSSNKYSKTARLMSEPLIKRSKIRLKATDFITTVNISLHNVKNQSVDIPLNRLTCVVGVSGCGKSTMFIDVISKAIVKHFQNDAHYDNCEAIQGLDKIKGIRVVDQKGVGRSSRSNPATYTGVFDDIRKIYAKQRESIIVGLKASDFSFNTAGGRCENCKGSGYIVTQMQFLPDIKTMCPLCLGKRYEKETLTVTYKGYDISDILGLTIDEALIVFKGEKIAKNLKLLSEVGVGYLQLGQEFSTLSGGEAQRIKLAKDLIDDSSTGYLYIFDEPSSGLHFSDSQRLLVLLQKIVDRGNTVVVIEHNPQFILESDHIIEIGPESGNRGGEIVFTGSPHEILSVKTHTASFLRNLI